ncbi:MAG TPA: zinc-binding dehydrogenase [Candidatus Eremiobacteraceae bacterium]|jgi:NADPH:quinone reductase-like Zn-dependent oxidoreductase|nr:zinc-binding dehydrogenase [Candidatus Eremiobacteraceae bacterium]
MMRALFATKTGGDDPLANIEIGDRPTPTPKAGEVRVRMRAATLNRHDLFTLQGIVGYPITLPRIIGCDGVGVVDEYGPDRPAGTPDPGSEVVLYPLTFCGECDACQGDDPMLCRSWTLLSDGPLEGTFAEFVVLPALHVIPKPPHLSDVEAAALGVSMLTAYRMLFVKAGLRPGQSVLVQAAGGGVGTAAVSLAAAAGVRVFASSRSEAKLALARRLGASDSVPAGKDAAKAILRLTGGNGVDAVIETVGEATWGTSLRAVRQGGAVVVAGATAGPNPPADLGRIFWRQLRIVGSSMGTLPEFRALLSTVASKDLRPVIDSTYPLNEGRSAFKRLVSDEHVGKIGLLLA